MGRGVGLVAIAGGAGGAGGGFCAGGFARVNVFGVLVEGSVTSGLEGAFPFPLDVVGAEETGGVGSTLGCVSWGGALPEILLV